jgi:hypothetical protein
MTFSRVFPSYHPRKGQPTYFLEKIWESIKMKDPDYISQFIWGDWLDHKFQPKHHTIRAGHRWKVGDKFSPRVWSGQPYQSKQIVIAPDIEVKKTWDFDVIDIGGIDCIRLNNEPFGQFHPLAKGCQDIAKNDGLTSIELIQWFSNPKPYGKYQIICWNENINY